MSVTDQYLANNEVYASTFDGPLPLPPEQACGRRGVHGRPARRLPGPRPG